MNYTLHTGNNVEVLSTLPDNSGTFMYYGNAETLAEIGAVKVQGK